MFRPGVAPRIGETYGLRDYLGCILNLVPISILIVLVLGSIYSGIATPTEAAAVGVAASFTMTLIMGQMNWKIFLDSLLGALKMSCMVCSLLAAAAFLSTTMGFLHIPQDISMTISSLNLPPYALIFILGIFYTVLGFFLDGISITVMSLPICLPLIVSAGFDPIWFGVFLVAMTEMAQITPPVGFNLFVLQGLTGRNIYEIAWWATPFFFLMCAGVLLFTIFPQIALYLPGLLFGK
jgi:tripartite ATP-independent transporter DctM subunit